MFTDLLHTWRPAQLASDTREWSSPVYEREREGSNASTLILYSNIQIIFHTKIWDSRSPALQFEYAWHFWRQWQIYDTLSVLPEMKTNPRFFHTWTFSPTTISCFLIRRTHSSCSVEKHFLNSEHSSTSGCGRRGCDCGFTFTQTYAGQANRPGRK